MSYMTDILNSMSKNVSSGYEILSFRIYWGKKKKKKKTELQKIYFTTTVCSVVT